MRKISWLNVKYPLFSAGIGGGGAGTVILSVQSEAKSVHANVLLSGIDGAADGEKNVPITVTFQSKSIDGGETRIIEEDLVIPKVDQVIVYLFYLTEKHIERGLV